jgi:hypothetical protein
MARMEDRGKPNQGNFHLERSDIGFLIGATIVVIGAVLLSLAFGVAPDAEMLVPPNPKPLFAISRLGRMPRDLLQNESKPRSPAGSLRAGLRHSCRSWKNSS